MKELEDFPHFPARLRNFQTEFIGFVAARFGVYAAFVRYVQSLQLPKQPMHDLCSGSGEPAISIFRECDCFNMLTLSDKYPNAVPINDPRIQYEQHSSDVLLMDFQPGVCYTMFNALHHFTDEEKLLLFHRMKKAGARAFFVEPLQPDVLTLLEVLFLTTVGNFFLAPFVKPFSWRRIFFTCVLPLNIFTIAFDGIVSVFKSKTVAAYRRLLQQHGNAGVFRLKQGAFRLVVIHLSPPDETTHRALEIQQAAHRDRERRQHFHAVRHHLRK